MAGERLRDDPGGVLGPGDVGGDEMGAEAGGSGAAGLDLGVADHHLCALLDKALGDAFADAARSADDDGDLPFETSGHDFRLLICRH